MLEMSNRIKDILRPLYPYMNLIYWDLRLLFQKKNLFFIRGKTGDLNFYCSHLESHLKNNHIKDYVFIGDGKNIQGILKLYPNIKPRRIIRLTEAQANRFQKYVLFQDGHIAHSLMWDQQLHGNVCRLRELEKFNFDDSFKYFLLGNKVTDQKTRAVFPDVESELESNAVLICPFAEYVKLLPQDFWRILIFELEARGYKIYINRDRRREVFDEKCDVLFLRYDELKNLEKCAGIIGLRSGFLDVAAQINCKKVVLYPTRHKELDLRSHRADISFSSFTACDLNSKNTFEITMPFCRNIGDPYWVDYRVANGAGILLWKDVISEILNHFPEIKSDDKKNSGKVQGQSER